MTQAATFRLVMTAAILVGSRVSATGATPQPDDAHVLNVIYGDEYLAANVREIVRQAAQLSADERYRFLADWVLPGEHHATFRLHADFTPTHPPPASGDHDATGFRVPTGGEIISPALDLIDMAATFGRLKELRKRVESIGADSMRFQIDRLALLAMIDMASNDLPSARVLLAEVFALVLSGEGPAVSQSDAVLLCVHQAAGHPPVCQSIVDATYSLTRTYQNTGDRTTWQRQFTAAYARVKHVAEREEDDPSGQANTAVLTQWSPASLPRARLRGAGVPVAQWFTASGQVENLSSHGEDFLYYAVPLRGEFEVECDAAMFGWHETEVFFAGKWVRSIYDHQSYKVGGFQGIEAQLPLVPPLTRGKKSIHYRDVVRNGLITTCIHGRRIHERRLAANHDPWLAIHSEHRHDGGVFNLRLTGIPQIPDEIRLTLDPDLDGWIPYYDETVGVDWRNLSGEIHAFRRSDLLDGCHQESALFYHRPILEDGSIEFEFWYDQGVCEAHPALDRLCLMLEPEGVKVHWLTDGPFDRTSQSPGNLLDEPENRRGSGPLPLKVRNWNHLQFTVRGSTVDLLLNGELVYRRDIEPTNQRHFGLFHYTDRTELRVRNVVWTGDWPRELPELDSQELAIDETGFLDERLPELRDAFSHDFAAAGLPLDRFAVTDGEIPVHVNARADGLYATRIGAGAGYISATVAPRITVSGDFDISATFEQLVTEATVNGSSNIFLVAVADTADECLLLRRRTLHRGRDQQLIQCSRVLREDGQTRRSFFAHQPMEAPAGTLRLARRGETVYYLFAENDSSNFRLIGRESFPLGDLPLYGVQLKLQTHGDDGLTSVVWRSLTIRAEELSGPAVEDQTGLLLNRDREQ